jgi:two-component system copper resistance phosphate regulon response regulator CusR
MKILVIEDSGKLRKSLRAGLWLLGYAVDVASDGAEGISYVKSCCYDVVVLDLMLPILQNLIYNAVSHSPDGALVSITADIRDGFCTLQIENPMSDPLTEQDLEMIFKRFWRKDSARETGWHAGIELA